MKKKGKPYGQTLGHTFGDAPVFTYTMTLGLRRRRDGQERRERGAQQQGHRRGREVHAGLLEGCCDEGGLAWDDTNNNRAFHAGELSATLNGASIYIVAKRQKDKIKDDKGEPMWTDIDHAPLPAGPAGAYLLFLDHSDAIMKYSKNQKLAKDFLKWIHLPENYGKWFQSQEALQRRRHQEVGERSHVGQGRRAAEDVPHGRPATPGSSATRGRRRRSPPRRSPSTSSPTCTPRRPRA